MIAVMIIGILDRLIHSTLGFITAALIIGVVYLAWAYPAGTRKSRLKPKAKKRKGPRLTVIDGYKKSNEKNKTLRTKKYYH
jgi:Ni,Fe-hydrogenase I cytochrome b subunit